MIAQDLVTIKRYSYYYIDSHNCFLAMNKEVTGIQLDLKVAVNKLNLVASIQVVAIGSYFQLAISTIGSKVTMLDPRNNFITTGNLYLKMENKSKVPLLTV